jgi:hypothetical protein
MLLKPTSEALVNVSTIYIASLDPNVQRIGGSIADFRVRLPNYLTNVISLELEDYSIPVDSLSLFTERNKVDFRMRNSLIFGGQWKTFALTIPVTSNTTPISRNSDLLGVLLDSFDELIRTDPDFGGKVKIVQLPDAFVFISLQGLPLPFSGWTGPNSTECELLFGTGENKSKSIGPYLGFEELDYSMQVIDFYGLEVMAVSGYKEAVINVYRFLDVFIDEFSTVEPWYRVFIPSVSGMSLVQPEINMRARMLDTPIRKTDTLTFHMRLQGGARPVSREAFYFNIKVFELKTSPNSLPSYSSRRSQML